MGKGGGMARSAGSTGDPPVVCGDPPQTPGMEDARVSEMARPVVRCSRRVAGNGRRAACAPLASLAHARLENLAYIAGRYE